MKFQNQQTTSSFWNLKTSEFNLKFPDAASLLSYVDAHKKSGKCYVFLDEIQNLENWQEACKTLRLENNSVFRFELMFLGGFLIRFDSFDKSKIPLFTLRNFVAKTFIAVIQVCP